MVILRRTVIKLHLWFAAGGRTLSRSGEADRAHMRFQPRSGGLTYGNPAAVLRAAPAGLRFDHEPYGEESPMRFFTLAGVAALLTMTAAAAQNVPRF